MPRPRWTLIALGFALALGCATEAPQRVSGSNWQEQMRAGAELDSSGKPAEALAHYRRALELARQEPHDPVRLAHAAWYVGDVCFENPGLCDRSEAERRVGQSFAIFAALYGPEHPVVIPILLRRSEIAARAGDTAAAQDLLEQADRITAQSFPDSHFMRSRSGSHRPASDLDPMELLRILADVDILGG